VVVVGGGVEELVLLGSPGPVGSDVVDGVVGTLLGDVVGFLLGEDVVCPVELR
jgi:hypothetical protein